MTMTTSTFSEHNKSIHRLCAASLLSSLLWTSAAQASDEKLEQRIKQLEERIQELESQAPQVIDNIEEQVDELYELTNNKVVINSFDSIRLDFGGFIHSAYTYIDAEDGSAGSFNRQNVELLIGADIGKNWSLFFCRWLFA